MRDYENTNDQKRSALTMYLDALDPVRTSNISGDSEKSKLYGIQGEAVLFKTLLEGKKPTLTQTQVMDSTVIHRILEKNSNDKNAFLSLVRNKQINIAMYSQLRENNVYGLKGYFLKTLQKGLKDNENFHHYSYLDFIQKLDKKNRVKFQEKIIDAIIHNHYQVKIDAVDAKDIEKTQLYIHNLSLLDYELRGQFISMGPFRKNFDTLVQKGCYTFLKNEQLSQDVHLLCQNILQHNNFANTRSIYYNFLADYENATDEAKALIKSLIDLCYNESIASTLPSHDYSLSFDSHLYELIEHADRSQEPLKKEQVLLVPSNDQSYFTWESINAFFKEIESLQSKHNISRLEAIETYKQQFGIHKPIIKVAQYLTLGLAPNIIPFGEVIANPIIEIVSNSIELVAGDMVEGKLKRPSIQDVAADLAEFKQQKIVAQKAYDFTLITK